MITEYLLFGTFLFSISSPIQMVIAELVYLSSIKRKKKFALRFSLALLFYILFLLFVPSTVKRDFTLIDLTNITVVAYATGYWLAVFWLSVFVFLFCFDGLRRNVLFCCSAGYCTQHISAMLYGELLELLPEMPQAISYLIEYSVCAAVYVLLWFLLARKIRFNRCANLDNGYIAFFSAAAIFINIILSMFRRMEPIGPITEAAESIYSVSCCVLVLFLQFSVFTRHELRHDLEVIKQLWARDSEQYKMRKEYIDAINIKCHDLKNVLHSLSADARPSYLSEMQKAISLYDSMIKTGNEALDVILSEKSLYCTGNQITLTCMVDGTKLAFMEDVDIYSCVGNALDNAIEAAMKQEGDRRVVSVSLNAREDFLCLHVENYYSGSLRIVNGLPKTTKSDSSNHGFGIRSMSMIAEKYGGRVSVSTEDGVFGLNIFLPAGGK